MSKRRLVEHKAVCCLMFLSAIALKVHSVLDRVFLNESFDECLRCIISFVKSHCVSNSKLV